MASAALHNTNSGTRGGTGPPDGFGGLGCWPFAVGVWQQTTSKIVNKTAVANLLKIGSKIESSDPVCIVCYIYTPLKYTPKINFRE
jgi:hypothetical protein